MKPLRIVNLFAVLALLLVPLAANANPPTVVKPAPAAATSAQAKTPTAACALLDDPTVRGLMSGMFETNLLIACGRASELGQVKSDAGTAGQPGVPYLGVDVIVNNPALDPDGTTHTQSETTIARNENTGTICSAYNDSYSLYQGLGATGFSRSTDGGVSFTDNGAVPNADGGVSYGDPSLVWRKTDGLFYITTLQVQPPNTIGLGLWKSTDDCASFTWVGMAHTPFASAYFDDKEMMAVDNNPASPYYGRLYIAANDLALIRMFAIYSPDGGTTWSVPRYLTLTGVAALGAWPTVAPNGDVYVAWVRWNPYPDGPIDIEVKRSTNGGTSFAAVTNPLTGGINPQASGPTTSCGRPALNGNIRYLPSPQIAVAPNGSLHVVYSRDPDGLNTGDVIDVYYRRSTDNGATWGAEVKLNDDATTRDQFFPTISVGPSGRVVATWYDRRLDPNNLLFDYYMRISPDGGATWLASQRVSDVSSPVYIDPSLAPCYHGDYDQQLQDATYAYIQWSDDRNIQSGHQDPDVWFDKTDTLVPYYTLDVTPPVQSVCAPANATFNVAIGSVLGYSDPVTLGASGNPAGTTAGFSVNPVTPPGSSTLTIGNTGAASAGTSTILVSATSTSGPRSASVTLNLYTAAAGQPTLLTPANGALNVPAAPTFTWSAASQASTYSIQVATDAGFSNVVASASGLVNPTWTSNATLSGSTTYYWRVQATNTCGTSAYSAVFSFTTWAAPGECGPGTVGNILYQYGFEAGAGGWTHSAAIGSDSWAISTANPHSGASHYRGLNPDTESDQRLVSPPVAIPSGQNPVVIKFWHVPDLEPNGTTECYDGGILETSTDGGSTWTQVLNANLLIGPYRGYVEGGPLSGLQAWCGTTSYFNTVADVSTLAGQTAQFRFRLGSDNQVSNPGWDVDDVTVQSCQPSGPTPTPTRTPTPTPTATPTRTPTPTATPTPAPGECGPGMVGNILYQYGFEAGAGGWTHSAAQGTDSWYIAMQNPHSGTSHYRGLDPVTVSDQRLVSPPVVVPTGQNPVVIKFWHVPALEPNGTIACYDGGILETSTNGGTTWTQVLNANMLVGSYRGTVSSSFGNPLGGLQAWCGTISYFNTVADVSSLAGQTVQFRFRLGSDNAAAMQGWDVDDVTVQSCQPSGPTPTPTPTPGCNEWDVNCDGLINVLDVQLVAGAWNNPPAYQAAYDHDHNGVVDIIDVELQVVHWASGGQAS